MFAYRERRLRAFDHAGAAEVKFLTAGNVEFKAAVALKAVVFDRADRSPARALMKL